MLEECTFFQFRFGHSSNNLQTSIASQKANHLFFLFKYGCRKSIMGSSMGNVTEDTTWGVLVTLLWISYVRGIYRVELLDFFLLAVRHIIRLYQGCVSQSQVLLVMSRSVCWDQFSCKFVSNGAVAQRESLQVVNGVSGMLSPWMSSHASCQDIILWIIERQKPIISTLWLTRRIYSQSD